MIDESIGKILGMAMAYGVSALGLFLAYANYRKRTLNAEKVMTPKAWGVVAAVVLAIVGGVLVVAQLAQPPSEAEHAPSQDEATEALGSMDFEETDAQPPAVASEQAESGVESASPAAGGADEDRSRWPLVGMMLPAVIFLVATWITAGLYRHFSSQPHPGTQSEAATESPPGSTT